ncbi:MAG: nucleotidyltransferase family protein [Deltaproteobacteria bacterium]|nr:nucleotidyltransferase family protein [Deltaproteobacteria bacterium]
MAEPVAGVLLAAGQGRRAGGPKALKTVDGQPWWRVQASAMVAELGCVVAVLHPDAWPEADGPLLGCIAVTGNPEAPQLASLQLGLALLPIGAALVLPIDCPWPGPAVAAALADLSAQTDALAVVPAVESHGQLRRGHPVWLSGPAVAAVLALDPATDRLDHWLAAQGDQVATVDVGEPAVLANFNADGVGR